MWLLYITTQPLLPTAVIALLIGFVAHRISQGLGSRSLLSKAGSLVSIVISIAGFVFGCLLLILWLLVTSQSTR